MAAFKINQADLQFVLQQIKMAEAHAAGIPLTSILLDANGAIIADPEALNGAGETYYVTDAATGRLIPRDAGQPLAIPDPHVPFGLRTVDGTDNNIVPGRETWGAADQSMPRLLDPKYTVGAGTVDLNGPAAGGQITGGDYADPGTIVDTAPRTISNLIVDQSLDNPAAIIAALTLAGSEDVLADQGEISAAHAALKAARDAKDTATIPALEAALDAVLDAKGVTVTNGSIDIANVAPDEGLSAPFNAWMTFFGQFFDHGLDLITKGGAGTVYIPLASDDPLVTHGPDGIMNTGDEVPAPLRFMSLTRATPSSDGSQTNTTTPFVDQNQTYTSHASHQVFLREYRMTDGGPVSTGRLLSGENGGLATWADVKAQAATMLGIELTDGDVLNIPLIQTDAYGEFIRGENGLPQLVKLNPNGLPATLIEGDLAAPVNTFAASAARIGHAFLDDIAHNANPLDSRSGQLKLADGDSGVGTAPLLADGFQSVDLSSGTPGVNVDPDRGNWLPQSPDGWVISGGAGGGTYDPTATVISETGHGGGNVVYLSDNASLARDTGVITQAGRSYTLSFNVGDRADLDFGGGVAELVTAGGTVLASTVLTAPQDGVWRPVTVSTGPVPAVSDGQELRIQITHGGNGGQILIDDVQLTSNVPQYDDELLDRHYISGDGRGNENIGLTAVHHIFHSEHNRQVDAQKLTILQSGDVAFVNEWHSAGIDEAALDAFNAAFDAAGDKGAFLGANALFNGAGWDGERLFQAARFATEMQYQHLVFEEFARKIQPNIDVFVFNSVTDVDPAIFSEFANTVYRFGHSMLTENMPRIGPDGAFLDTNLGLVEAFLNPVLFDNDGGLSHDEGAAALVRGMTIERGSEIDEFVVGALRNNLLGLPLDLAAINIARGRDTGMPSLNDARGQLYAASGSTFLKPYDHWADFAANLKNPASIVNFIAAYGTHDTITGATSLEGKRDAAMAIVFGGDGSPLDRTQFLTGTGAWAGAETGLDDVDLWIGGLAEKKMPFGGFLGSTFNAVFELQLENLQDGDRFYYLTRTQGQNMLNALEQNSFAKMIMANTALAAAGPDGIRGTSDDVVLRHIGVDAFATYDYVLEVDVANQADYDPDDLSASGKDPTGADPFLEAVGLGKVVRTDPSGAVGANYIRIFGGEHAVVGGTDGNDTIITDFGDDGIWGDAGDDRIESGAGVDLVNGGAGDDIITDSGDTGDFLKGDEGDDVIANSNGLDILMGGSGRDVFFVGIDATEVFAGEGDDFILGGDDADFLLGNEGDDWMEGGGGFDTTAGDNSELFFNSAIKGHDVMFAGNDEHDFDAESGDDIMVQGESVVRNEGMFGFDWSIFKGVSFGADADLRVPIFTTEQADILRNRFDKVEALSGWMHDDILRGDDRVRNTDVGATIGTAEGVFFEDELTQAGIDRIDGLRALLGTLVENAGPGDRETQVAFDGGNILLGGGGGDLIQGNGGDDFIDGDAWLNVRIRITGAGEENSDANEIATVDSLKHVFAAGEAPATWVGKSLFELMISRTIVPNQLHIVREIRDGGETGEADVAVFNDVMANYTITTNPDGTITVTHDAVTPGAVDPLTGRNLVSDGVDTLRNIEVIRFSDQNYTIAQPATGAPVISDASPTQGEALTVDLSGIGDPNGMATATLAVRWQSLGLSGWSDIEGAVGASFTPALAQVNLQLRAAVSFTDDAGNAEELFSQPTQTVGLRFVGTGAAADTVSGTPGADFINGAGGIDVLSGLGGDDMLLGGNGNDTLNGGAGDDELTGGLGADTVNGGDGDDTIVWSSGTAGATLAGSDGRDRVDGGAQDGADTFVVNGNASAETFTVWTRAAWVAQAPLAQQANVDADTEIVVTRNGNNFGQLFAQLRGIEEIVVNTVPVGAAGGPAGGDTVTLVGDFSATSLALNTVTINGSEAGDTVDISSILSAHRILFRSNGGNDTIIGDLRPQDVVELAPGQDRATYALVDNGDGTRSFTNGAHAIRFTGAVPPIFQNTPPPSGNEEGVSGAFEYTPSDLAGLKALVNGQKPAAAGDDDVPTGVRALSGAGNNEANSGWGAADEAFIRITSPHYGDHDGDGNRAINPIFAGLDPRTISDILGAQEDGLPKAGNDANIFFMAMGQYIDHGLDFLPKGGNGSIQIGASGTSFPGSQGPANPADLTRGTVIGYDEDGVPQHKNQTSPYVDQNQAYGSHALIGQFLRESDGQQGHGMRLFSGAADPSNPDFSLLPTLRELIQHHWSANTIFTDPSLPGGQISFRDYYTAYQIDAETTGTLFDAETGAFDPGVVSKMISNFMGSTHPLLLDANPFIDVLDHYMAGDGRANENFALTSIHTIWARNHNHHVDGLLAAGFEGTADEVFQAAKMINEAEYQRVVFDEYLDTLLGGLRSEGTHGFEAYDPNANAAISHEFAAAAFRFGHSLIGETLTVLDADGNPTEVKLFDAFLNPSNAPGVFTGPLPQGYSPQPGYAQHGVNAIIGGNIGQPSEAVDFNIVDAVRNDLVRISADLFAFNVARGWDVGLGTLNQIRMDLSASSDPYVAQAVGFAGGNLTPYSSWADFQARNGLSEAVIAQFMEAYPDLLLAEDDIAAFRAINPDIGITLQTDGTGLVKGIDRVDFWVGGLAERHINDGIVGETFWVVLSEQFERLQDADRFYYIDRLDDFDFYETFIDGQEFADIVARNTGMADLPEHMFRTDEEDGDGDSDGEDDGDQDEDGEDSAGNGEDADGDADEDGDDSTTDDGGDGEDDDDADGGDDDDAGNPVEEDEDDTASPPAPATGAGLAVAGTAAADVMTGSAAADVFSGGDGDDIVLGGDGGDTLMGGKGEDLVKGDGGRDMIFGGADDDVLFGGTGEDMIFGDAGDDRLFGDDGDDMLEGAAGSDVVYGGAGNDRFVARQGDGDDIYWGEGGHDMLDYAAITANLTVDLGNGTLRHGSVSSAQSGHDAVFGFEDIVGGAGNDQIIASAVANVMDGGGGHDTFVFRSVADADGDLIKGFAHGDRIDLSGMAGPEGFTLSATSLTGSGQVLVTHVTGDDGEALTRIQGNVSGGSGADFTLDVAGHHALTLSDFTGVS